ncbi:MAG TPA: aminotransferase class I/II-fold pyridoxal phosphate-dependent enzyme [Clostridia bacterium]|nr:aminotransferase class I/II-fold pyridoxal phosphate-dependent enzyme [Clostridia bacterium]
MNNAPIIDKLLQLNKQNMVSFHMPGHKNGRIYDKVLYKNFKDILYKLDTTEIEGTDNLHNAKEMIKESQQKARRIFKSEETFFLINGSTSGIYSMIMAATSPGDKILIDRNCHQAIINACILGDLAPVYVYPDMDEKWGIAMEVSPDDIETQLIKHNDIKAVVLTYPTYYGIVCNLKKVEKIVHKYDKMLLIDEAHGAHLGLNKDLPLPALSCGADAAVQSTHKTLPSFTQSSMLHIQGNRIDRDRLRFMLRIHQSSSPSYLLLSSLDFAVMVYETKGKCLMGDLLENIRDFRQKIKETDGIDIMGNDVMENKDFKSMDITRLWIGIKNITGYELERRLRENFNIQMELSNRYGVLGVASIANTRYDFDKLLNALKEISEDAEGKRTEQLQNSVFRGNPAFENIEQVFTPREALYKSRKKILFEKSQGCISGEYIIPYPPGIPLVVPGERISDEIIQQVMSIIDGGGEILGLCDSSCRWIEAIT